jgi:hypothetical protein
VLKLNCNKFNEVEDARKDLLISFLSSASEKVSDEEFILMVYCEGEYIEKSKQCLGCESLCQLNKGVIAVEEIEKIV